MTVLHQPSMFDVLPDETAEPELGRLDTMTRTDLSDGAWVDHLPGWLTGSDAVLDTLIKDVPWRAEERQMYDRKVVVPRLLCWYTGTEPFPHPVLDAARAALNAHYRPRPDDRLVTAGLCLYRDGADSVAWHGDRIGRGAHADTLVAILSVCRLGPCAGAAPERRWPRAEVPARPRGPGGDGRQLPTHLGARRAQDGKTGRPAGQRSVPPGGSRLTGGTLDEGRRRESPVKTVMGWIDKVVSALARRKVDKDERRRSR